MKNLTSQQESSSRGSTVTVPSGSIRGENSQPQTKPPPPQHDSSKPFCCDLLSSRERNTEETPLPPSPLLIPIRTVHLGLSLGKLSLGKKRKIPPSSVFSPHLKGKERFDKGRHPKKVCWGLVLFDKN